MDSCVSSYIFLALLCSFLVKSCVTMHHHHHLHIGSAQASKQTSNSTNLLVNSPRSFDKIRTKRQFLLFNQCSHNFMSVLDRHITARAQEDDEFALMSLETIGGNPIGIRIQSVSAGVYVCFNKRGKLFARYNSNNLGCLFTEETTPSRHIKFRSLYNQDWYLGFTKQGKPIHGKIPTGTQGQHHLRHQHRKREKCYQFVKKSAQQSHSEPVLDSSHEVLHNYERPIGPIVVKANSANGNTDVINSRNSFRVKPNDKPVLRLMSTSSAPNSRQLIYTFSNYNNLNDYNKEDYSTKSPTINQNSDVRRFDRLRRRGSATAKRRTAGAGDERPLNSSQEQNIQNARQKTTAN